jgi:hypothetical protein
MISLTLVLKEMPTGMGVLGWRAHMGIELSQWCREHGLVRDKDYDWAFMPNDRAIHFRFYGENESFASLFAIRWAEYL